jgi:hypothetical protein
MKGIKESGACKITPNADGDVDYMCSSEHTLAGAGSGEAVNEGKGWSGPS